MEGRGLGSVEGVDPGAGALGEGRGGATGRQI